MTQLKNSNQNLNNIKDIEFETAEKHKKGMVTEDSVINRLTKIAKSHKAEILRRVEPPHYSEVGECDSILFDNSGIYLIEIKRYGGVIKNLNEKLEIISIEQGDKIKKIDNPIIKLYEKSKKLFEFIAHSPEWKLVNKFSQYENLGDVIPIFSVLCFGPTTEITKSDYNANNLLVCNSRTIEKRLLEFIGTKPTVIGLAQLAKKATSTWTIQGILKASGKAGFIRCYPVRVFGKTTIPFGVTKIKGTKGRRLEVTYDDKVKIYTKEIESIIFKYNANNKWGKIMIDSNSNFVWTSGSKK